MNVFRKILWFIVLLSVCTVFGSFYSQYVLGLSPCVLCILQRLAVMAVGLLALVCAFSRQAGKAARTFSAVLVSIPAVYGAGVAVYQLYIQSLPPGAAPSCGAPWTFRLRDWPLFECSFRTFLRLSTAPTAVPTSRERVWAWRLPNISSTSTTAKSLPKISNPTA